MDIPYRIKAISERVEKACLFVKRSPSEITIIGASKAQPPDKISKAFAAGIHSFGENYLQEYLRKSADCPAGIEWHYIGRIQSNKASKIGECFDWIQTLDSEHKARLVSEGAIKSGRMKNVLVEVNIANEPQKGGIPPTEVAKFVNILYSLDGIRVRGLMTMGPPNPSPEDLRLYFKRMRGLLESLKDERMDTLSMGMSEDFEIAIQEGATHVRIGRALFGERDS